MKSLTLNSQQIAEIKTLVDVATQIKADIESGVSDFETLACCQEYDSLLPAVLATLSSYGGK